MTTDPALAAHRSLHQEVPCEDARVAPRPNPWIHTPDPLGPLLLGGKRLDPPTPAECLLRGLAGVVLFATPAVFALGELTSVLACVLYGVLLIPLTALEAFFMRRPERIQPLAIPAAWLLSACGVVLVNAQAAFTASILRGGDSWAGLERALRAILSFEHPLLCLALVVQSLLFASCVFWRVQGRRWSRLFKPQGLLTSVALLVLFAAPLGVDLGVRLHLYMVYMFALALPFSGHLAEAWAKNWEKARLESIRYAD